MTRSQRKWTVRVNEGEWYAVPLRNGGYGVGVVARKGKSGALFGYFFGPRYEHLPKLDNVRNLRPNAALFCEIFGDLGIQNGEWTLLGRVEPWDRNDWPLPEFGRIEDEARGIAWIVSYENTDISTLGEERRCSVEEARRLPPNRAAGYGAVEIWLTQKLLS